MSLPEILKVKPPQKPRRPWLVEGFGSKELQAFHSIASRWAGDLPPAAAYLLNFWIHTPDGTSWLLREGSDVAVDMGQCEEVFGMCVLTARRAVIKRANLQYDGMVEIALRQTIRDALGILGLPELY